jgi:hypothetical protein
LRVFGDQCIPSTGSGGLPQVLHIEDEAAIKAGKLSPFKPLDRIKGDVLAAAQTVLRILHNHSLHKTLDYKRRSAAISSSERISPRNAQTRHERFFASRLPHDLRD